MIIIRALISISVFTVLLWILFQPSEEFRCTKYIEIDRTIMCDMREL